MRDTLKYLNDILALLTLPIYLLMPLTALAGRALESRAPGHLSPSWAFIASDTFLVIAVGLFLWCLIVYMLAIGKLQSSGMNSCCLEVVFAIFVEPCGYLLLAGVLVAGAVFKWLM
jgi:hypothetical protein